MVRVAAVGGNQAKLVLVQEEPGVLALDGVERNGEAWRPRPVGLPPGAATALQEMLDALEPAPSALHLLLAESLPLKNR
jgi:hypothetical protein